MKYLLTVILGGGFMMIQQPTWNPQPQQIMPHQPMPVMERAPSHLDNYMGQIRSIERDTRGFADTMEGIRRDQDQSED